MKFFWKLFISTLLISASFFSIGSYFLVNTSFSASMNRELATADYENDILRTTLSMGIKKTTESLAAQGHLEVTEDMSTLERQWIRDTAQSLVFNSSQGLLSFRIKDAKGNLVYESGTLPSGGRLIPQLTENSRGNELLHMDNKYYIHAASPFLAFNDTLYVENYRDITSIFKDRDTQYRTFIYLIPILTAVSAIVVFMITSWLVKPIKQLSRTTKSFAKGDYSKRVKIKTQDEIGQLATDFNHMANHLEQNIEALKDSASRQEIFIGNFAHELKTPLTSIIGYADMMRTKKLSQEQLITSADYIFNEGKRLEALSMKLLELIVLKNHDFTLLPVNMKDFLEKIRGVMLPVFENSGIRLSVHAEASVVILEPDLIQTVCMNLLDNARKAIDGNGYVVLYGKKTKQGYLVSVTDNGKGIDPSQLSKITEAFYMVDKSRARSQGGAGLGLSICSEIVRLHDGTLNFESIPGKGTRVTMYLKDKEDLH